MSHVKYRFKNGKLVSIPDAELAPGTVAVREVGTGEKYYADAEHVKPGDIFYWDRVPDASAKAALAIRKQLLPFIECSETDWLDDFRRDMHPWKEIGMWAAAGQQYQEAIKKYALKAPSDRRAVFTAVVAAITSDSPRHVPMRVDESSLMRKQIVKIAEGVVAATKAEWCIDLVVSVYCDFVPDRSVPIHMTDEQRVAFFNQRSK